jgi:hypothetical protein
MCVGQDGTEVHEWGNDVMAWRIRRATDKAQSAHTPSPELVAEALRHPSGWVYEIDGEMVADPDGEVPPEAIIGAWEVDQQGKLTGSYKANPNYDSGHEA